MEGPEEGVPEFQRVEGRQIHTVQLQTELLFPRSDNSGNSNEVKSLSGCVTLKCPMDMNDLHAGQ